MSEAVGERTRAESLVQRCCDVRTRTERIAEPHLPDGDRRLRAFLGSTIGNFYREERRAFLGALADTLEPGEWLLLGVDLVKDPGRLVDAYHDAQGTPARFIRNVLHSLNEQRDANFSVDQFDYVPLWDAREERIDLRLRAAMPMDVMIGALDLETTFTEGEELRVRSPPSSASTG